MSVTPREELLSMLDTETTAALVASLGERPCAIAVGFMQAALEAPEWAGAVIRIALGEGWTEDLLAERLAGIRRLISRVPVNFEEAAS